ncbi:hypothetical protein F3J37_01550 [Pantoea sp. Al-1710]|uniref:Flagellar motor switch protein FliN-like C-terminal domain-containing protein n=1 Tax=Candidatus Pantoea communis TaxID=2608354 RepID=A0ABX0RI93_9GAMM|nr:MULTISPECIES: FliM/FliN family flagellar motor switch protein [Pantoea]NIG12936.1 hypothetical protein [Pantoea sp. Cy-640]NIG17363.1 hypothetical protein [Pantoea communis]
MMFPFVTIKEATLRRWIGAGRKLSFRRDLNDGFFQIKMVEGVSTSSFYHLHCAHGPIEINDPASFLALVADIPTFSEAANDPQPWFIELVNGRMNEDFKTLFRFFTTSKEEETDFLTADITIMKGDVETHFLARLSFELLDLWMSEKILDPMAIPFPVALPIKMPFVLGQFSLSVERLQSLTEGDLLLPTMPFMTVEGEGVIPLSGTEFYFELEPETNNSHQYLIRITRKQVRIMNEEHDENEVVVEEALDQVPEVSPHSFGGLKLDLTIHCGNLSMTLGELQNLDAGSMLLVDHVTPGEALLCHGTHILGKGLLVNVNGALGLKLQNVFRGTGEA